MARGILCASVLPLDYGPLVDLMERLGKKWDIQGDCKIEVSGIANESFFWCLDVWLREMSGPRAADNAKRKATTPQHKRTDYLHLTSQRKTSRSKDT
jgi:hypothetical protein